jgi:hypothetical protein
VSRQGKPEEAVMPGDGGRAPDVSEQRAEDYNTGWAQLNEGLIADECWPLVRNVRLVTNGLLARGLVTLGDWWDEGVGYELHLTELGLRWAKEDRDA